MIYQKFDNDISTIWIFLPAIRYDTIYRYESIFRHVRSSAIYMSQTTPLANNRHGVISRAISGGLLADWAYSLYIPTSLRTADHIA